MIPSEVTQVARAIQLAVAPVFLLAGIGGVLKVIVTRLNRVVDRARVVKRLRPDSSGAEHARHVLELRVLDRRISLASNANFLCVASAITVCSVITLPFLGELAKFNVTNVVAAMFVLAMALLAIGLVLFLIETRIAVASIHCREELLQRERRGLRRFGF